MTWEDLERALVWMVIQGCPPRSWLGFTRAEWALWAPVRDAYLRRWPST